MPLETGQEQGDFPFAFWEIFQKKLFSINKESGIRSCNDIGLKLLHVV